MCCDTFPDRSYLLAYSVFDLIIIFFAEVIRWKRPSVLAVALFCETSLDPRAEPCRSGELHRFSARLSTGKYYHERASHGATQGNSSKQPTPLLEGLWHTVSWSVVFQYSFTKATNVQNDGIGLAEAVGGARIFPKQCNARYWYWFAFQAIQCSVPFRVLRRTLP